MFKLNNYGFLISLTLHLLIIAIPVSKADFRHFREIELFVMDESPASIHKKELKQRLKEMPKPVVKEMSLPVKNEPEKIDERKEIVVSSIIEPAVVSNQPELTPGLASSVEIPKTLPESIVSPTKDIGCLDTPCVEISKTLPESIISPASVPQMLEDVEFGSKNAPAFLHRQMPRYPLMARKLGKEGRVLLRLTIDENGNLINIEVLESAGYGFTEATLEAVKKSTFIPAKISGKPVISKVLLPVKFTLRDSK